MKLRKIKVDEGSGEVRDVNNVRLDCPMIYHADTDEFEPCSPDCLWFATDDNPVVNGRGIKNYIYCHGIKIGELINSGKAGEGDVE